MTNLRLRADHKICGYARDAVASSLEQCQPLNRRSEAGYTLVALLALMTVLALFAMAAAPRIQQQAEREREKEAIFRGEQVADAIRAYYINRTTLLRVAGDQALPSSMDQLLEGIPVPGGAKNRQILRASAARDPLTIDGEWRFVHPRSEELINFQQSVMLYSGNLLPRPQSPQMVQLQQFAVPQITTIVNLGASTKTSGSSSAADDSSGPFVGVSSRSDRDSVLTYYGIENHHDWIFTPLFRN